MTCKVGAKENVRKKTLIHLVALVTKQTGYTWQFRSINITDVIRHFLSGYDKWSSVKGFGIQLPGIVFLHVGPALVKVPNVA